MNLIKILDYQSLIWLLYLAKSLCQDKYVYSIKSEAGIFQIKSDEMKDNKVLFTQQFTKFNDDPKILLGMSFLHQKQFSNNENEFNIYAQEVNKSSAKIYFSTPNQSSNNMERMYINYFAFQSNEALVQNIKIDEKDFEKFVQQVGSYPKSQSKLLNHQLQKKQNAKRNIQCFIIGFRQMFSTIPKYDTDQLLSFFVETVNEINENQFKLTYTTFDQSNTLKWVNINCIEYYQYDQNFEPFEFIQTINENKYGQSQIKAKDSYLPEYSYYEIKSQAKDISLKYKETFYGLTGIDTQIYDPFYIQYYLAKEEQELYFKSPTTKLRAITCSFVLFKMKNCPENCENCSDYQTCQKCKLKYGLNKASKCISCKDNCRFCDSDLNCLSCDLQYYLYQGQCQINKPKSTYCIQRPYQLI